MFVIFIASKPKQRYKLSKYFLMLIGIIGLSVAGLLHYDAFYRPKVGSLGSRVMTQEYMVAMTSLIGISVLALLFGDTRFFIEHRIDKG